MRASLRHSQKLPHVRLLEPYSDIVSHSDDWYAELASEIDHFSALIYLYCNIMLGIGEVISLEKLLGKVAKVAIGGAVDDDVFHIFLVYHGGQASPF